MRRFTPLLAAWLLLGCGPGQGSPDGGENDALVDADQTSWSDADGSASVDSDQGRPDTVVGPDADSLVNGCTPATVAAAISQARISATIQDLSSLPERTTHGGQTAAADLLQGALDGAGISHEVLEYTYAGQTYRNIEVEIPGTDLAHEIYVAGAHYDSTSSTPGDAPGADDNASGTAALLESARALHECSFRRTIRLVFFSNEEAGAVGSAFYAGDAADRGDDIKGFLALDLIAYGPPDEDLDVSTKPAHAWLASRIVEVSETVAGQPAREVIDDSCG